MSLCELLQDQQKFSVTSRIEYQTYLKPAQYFSWTFGINYYKFYQSSIHLIFGAVLGQSSINVLTS
jgi:hypothetical protein